MQWMKTTTAQRGFPVWENLLYGQYVGPSKGKGYSDLAIYRDGIIVKKRFTNNSLIAFNGPEDMDEQELLAWSLYRMKE